MCRKLKRQLSTIRIAAELPPSRSHKFYRCIDGFERRDFLYRLSEGIHKHTLHCEWQGERVLTQRAGGCVPSRTKDVDGNGRGSRAGVEPDEYPRQYLCEHRTSGGTREIKPFVPALEPFRIPPQESF